MRSYSHALYLTLLQDLHKWIPSDLYLASPTQVQTGSLPRNRKEFASLALAKSLLKKNSDDVSADADSKALSLFMSMNDKCCLEFDLFRLDTPELMCVSKAATLIDKWVNRGPSSILDTPYHLNGDFGPGASRMASGNSFYHKSCSGRLSMTSSSLYAQYLRAVWSDPTWYSAEIFRRDKFGSPHLVSGCKLSFVPKTANISRTICVEPSLNMFVQKGLAHVLERCLSSRLGFDLKDQQFRNRELARIGSVTGEYCTIDLSSASDTISVGLCKAILPPNLFDALMSCRSPTVELPNGDIHELRMISSMGNAFTFPLQTMIFSAIVLSVYDFLDIPFERPYHGLTVLGNTGVFGDDIIVRREAYDLVVRVLHACGFLVNLDKSYRDGRFRESCGGDYFDGHNVRGVYSKTLRSTHALYSLINRLNVWSANNDIPLPATIGFLMERVRFLPVPPWESDIAGIKVPSLLANARRDRNGSYLYRRLRARTISVDVSSPENSASASFKKYRLVYNPEGILLCAVRGKVRDGRIGIRLDVVKPAYTVGIAPCWDYIDMEHSLLEGVGVRQWSNTVWVNIGNVT